MKRSFNYLFIIKKILIAYLNNRINNNTNKLTNYNDI